MNKKQFLEISFVIASIIFLLSGFSMLFFAIIEKDVIFTILSFASLYIYWEIIKLNIKTKEKLKDNA